MIRRSIFFLGRRVPVSPTVNYTAWRGLARSSAAPPSAETPADKATTYVVSLGHEPDVARGVVDALRASGADGPALLAMTRSLAGRPEVGEDAGLDNLAASVKTELARLAGKKLVSFTVVPPPRADGSLSAEPFEVEAIEGSTIADVAKHGDSPNAQLLAEQLECACSGVMACSTCQVVVDPSWYDKVGEPEEAEQDMLDLAYEPTDTSRLGCQLVLTRDLDGLVVHLPRDANNIMDPIPFA